MRDQAEWVELIKVSANSNMIFVAVSNNIGREISSEQQVYDGGQALHRIANRLADGAV